MKIRNYFFNVVNPEYLDVLFEAKSTVKKTKSNAGKQVPQPEQGKKKDNVKPTATATQPEQGKKKASKITPEQQARWDSKEYSAAKQNWTIKNSPNGVYATAVKDNIIKLKDPSGKVKPEEHSMDDTETAGGEKLDHEAKSKLIGNKEFTEIATSTEPASVKSDHFNSLLKRIKDPDEKEEFLEKIHNSYKDNAPSWLKNVYDKHKKIGDDEGEEAKGKKKTPKAGEKGKEVKGKEEKPEDEFHHSNYISPSWSKKEKEEVDSAFRGKTKPEKLSPNAKKKYEKVTGDIQKARDKKFEKEENEKKQAEREKIPYASEKRTVAGKDKTLRKTNVIKEKSFTEDHPVKENNYVDQAKKFDGKNLYNFPPYKMSSSIKMDKIPKKYRTILERMVNTKIYDETGKQPPITFFTGGVAGAGAIRAQAGEILTMAASTMNDKEFNAFYDEVEKHIKARPNKDDMQVVTLDWLKAAKLSRENIQKYIQKKYPGGEVVAGSWDVQSEVEAMGLDNYKKNKGNSTDMYLRVKDKNGKERLVEVSLKKDLKVNLLNSGAGKFKEWDSTIPKEIDQDVYAEKQGNKLNGFVKNHQTKIEKLLKSNTAAAKELKKTMAKKKIDIEYALSDSGKARDKKKVLIAAAQALAKSGDADAKKFLEEIDKDSRTFATKGIQHLVKNEKMKNGMLEEIRNEFPLKSVMEKEEMAALDGVTLDDETAFKIFKTKDWNKIKENLKMVDGDPPSLAYEAESGGELIPIADIVIREDGVGYGGTFKFEMKLSPKFAKIMTDASDEIYGMSSDRAEKAKKTADTAAKKKAEQDAIAQRKAEREAKKKKKLQKSSYEYPWSKNVDVLVEKYTEFYK